MKITNKKINLFIYFIIISFKFFINYYKFYLKTVELKNYIKFKILWL